MILIVGNAHDDIVYFDSILKNKKKELVLNKFPATIGTLFTQEVMLIEGIYTSILSSALITYIIEKYFVLVVFSVGKCQMLPAEGYKIGDIAVSRRILFGDVNVSDIDSTQLGQIPQFPRTFEVQQDILLTLLSSLSSKTYSKYFEATFISCDVHFKNDNELQFIKQGDFVMGYDKDFVFDTESAGMALAGFIHDIPVISIKVVGNIIGKKTTTDDYLTILKQYASLGRAVVSTISDISKNDVIRE